MDYYEKVMPEQPKAAKNDETVKHEESEQPKATKIDETTLSPNKISSLFVSKIGYSLTGGHA